MFKVLVGEFVEKVQQPATVTDADDDDDDNDAPPPPPPVRVVDSKADATADDLKGKRLGIT